MLAQELRPGDAGANDAADNIDILAQTVTQVPAACRKKILFRADGAGFSHGLLAWIATAGGRTHPSFSWEYSTGWTFTQREMKAVTALDALQEQEQEQPEEEREPSSEETGSFPIPSGPGRTHQLGEGGGTSEPDEEAYYQVFKQSINGSYPTPREFSDNVEATYGVPVPDADAKRMALRFTNRHTAQLEEDHIA